MIEEFGFYTYNKCIQSNEYDREQDDAYIVIKTLDECKRKRKIAVRLCSTRKRKNILNNIKITNEKYVQDIFLNARLTLNVYRKHYFQSFLRVKTISDLIPLNK